MIKYLLLILIAISFLFFKLERDDHSDIPGLDSTNLHAGLYLPKGFTATVWAESPQFYNPTNMDVDAKGRVWVTEAVNYRNYNNDSTKFIHHAKGDRVMILEDTDGDGKSDRSKVFVEDKDLVSPLGIAVIGNKVIVSCAPSIIVYTDNDGDDKPDSKEIFLTGFGGKDHDHSLHSLVAGPDGKWYFNVGNAGPHEVKDKAGWNLRSGSLYTGGSPYNKENTGGQKSDDGKIWVGGLAMRIGQDGKGLEVMAHNFRNAYELALDSYGNMWQSDNDDQVVTCRTSYVMEGGNAGYFSADGNRYWQADQRPGQSTFTAHWHQEDPGVMPAGDNTGAGSPTGMVVYEGDAFGNQYRGMLLSCEAGKNVIYGYKPKPKGAGFELKRKNFISTLKTVDDNYKWDEKVTSESKWFRPSDISVGTDGALYIADWYDPVVGGHKMDDPKGFGRIYRITPTGKNLKLPHIDLNSVNGQIQALLNPAINVRNAGFVALKAQGTQVIDQVREVLKSTNAFHRARAVWLMAQLGESGKAEVKQLLNDKDAAIRLTAFRALKQDKATLPALLKIAVNDTSAAVRREVAIALRDLPAAESTKLIVSLATRSDGNDPWYLNALGIAATGKEDLVYTAIKKAIGNDDPLQWSNKFAKIAWRIHPATAIKDLTARAGSLKISKEERKRAITALAFINTTESVESMLELQKSTLADVKENAGYWINFRKSNDWFSLYDWSKISEKKDTDSKTNKELEKLQANLEKTRSSPKDHESMTFSIPEINKIAGNIKKGNVIFNTKCAICHKVGDFGKTIGPDLTNINKKYDKGSLLDAIINPSAAIVFGYEPWVVTMKDETVVSGFMLSQGNTLVIKDLAGKQHVLDVQKVKEKKQLTTSIMPDPRGLALSKNDLADISAYIFSLGKSSKIKKR
ncbi:PVC-type heme-binding CxxCH protein [Pedobacter foliorum]|uniref:PVC-type heme-binding CxxCH protein n=1 Tax=Pedobacter foliorum TaxID=2739058 RepID=UPI001566BBB9|nr:PVC-type heme-binding CxxCH protein [Pedobacter foliorum]NRF40169.1 HEAT repeat domain-containing protein [Pedobacter foliorum]